MDFLTRDGKNVPNVPTDVLNTKVAYEHDATGWGGWVEGSYFNSYFLNNSNTFSIPSYVVANVNVHKNFELKNSWFRFARFYLEIDNIADKKYAASGQVIGGETAGQRLGQQAFFAGYGRAIYGGVTLGLLSSGAAGAVDTWPIGHLFNPEVAVNKELMPVGESADVSWR